MNDILPILQFIWQKGPIALLVIFILLIIQNPDRAEKIKEYFFLPFFRFFKRGSRQYMAAKIGYTTTEFFKKDVHRFIPSSPNVKIKINWVRSSSDPIMTQDGTLVLCLRETNDQTRNILAATQVALPRIVCSTLRPYIQESVSSAIDLALLRKLADGLGKHARPVFQRYFLSPAAQDNPEIQDLFAKVLEIDEAGTFVAVFLEEINLLGETLYTTGDQGDKTHHLIEFLEYLLAEARREEDEHIRLGYISRQFKVGIILLALSYRAHREGITPYLRRLNDYIKLGCDSIYIIAYPQAFDFLKRILDAVDGDDRVSLVKTCRVKTKSFADHSYEARKIALFRPRPLFSDSSFEEKVKAMGIENGSRIDAEVFDISRNFAMVDAKGLNGIIRRQDCSWRMVSSCQDLLALGKKYQFIVTSIDPSRSLLKLSLRDPDQDPWKSDRLPELGDVVEVQIVDCNGFCYTGLYEDDIEICIPRYELSWTETPPPDSTDLLNTTQKVVIYEKSDQAQELKGSLRQLEEDPWPNIHQRLPKGTELRGTVAEVNPHFVRVNLPDGLQGIIPSEAMVKAGFEYADYQKNVVVGQGLDVVVTKVFLKKKKIRLDLKRNLPDQTD